MSNTRLWDKLGKTDPSNTKSFKRAGGFSGTAIKPMWSFKRMTEEFGPCGEGWGVNEPSFQTIPGHNGELMVYCTVSVWYSEALDGEDGKPYYRMNNPVFGVGGDKVVTYIKANEQYNRPERWENDDEAFKKAYTDAIGNALKLIGVGADVHMGLFDDSKYVNEMRQEFAEEPAKSQQRRPVAAESNNPSPEQPSLYKRLSVANSACADKAAFNALWGNPATIKAQSSLSVNESTWLEKEKAKKFAELEVNEPSDYVPPSFDDLPEPTQQAVKNLGAG